MSTEQDKKLEAFMKTFSPEAPAPNPNEAEKIWTTLGARSRRNRIIRQALAASILLFAFWSVREISRKKEALLTANTQSQEVVTLVANSFYGDATWSDSDDDRIGNEYVLLAEAVAQ